MPTPMLPFALIMKSVVSDPPPAEVEETAKSVEKLVVEVAEKDETGKFWVIKRGKISEGFHS